MSESLYSILRINKLSLADLTEARIHFEPSVASLASERFTREDSLRLQENLDGAAAMIQSGVPVHAQFLEFHSLVAEATHNPVICITMKTRQDHSTDGHRDIRHCELHKRVSGCGLSWSVALFYAMVAALPILLAFPQISPWLPSADEEIA